MNTSPPLQARSPLVDWNQGFARHWNDADPALTHVFNALSFLFPQGERFFIDSAREIARSTDLRDDPALADAVHGFIAQEAIHTHQHRQYNAVLESQGYRNVAHDFVEFLQARAQKDFSPLTRLALVCAYEHYTAVLGDYLLGHPDAMRRADASLALVWGWHAVEETEHKAVCFDLYCHAGGGWLRRSLAFLLVSLNFSLMFLRLYVHLLGRDGCFAPKRLSATLVSASRFFFGRQGVGWQVLRQGLKYLAPGFHPWQCDNRAPMRQWLAEHSARLRTVGTSREDHERVAPA